MKTTVRFLAISAFVLLIAAPAALAQAPLPEVSTLPVNEPLNVGGTILQPGTYLIKVVSPISDRNKVQITNMEGTKVYATVITVPHDLEPNEEYPSTTFVFYPPSDGQPRALRTWFPAKPVSGHGHDIVYDNPPDRMARMDTGTATSETTVQTQTQTEMTPAAPEPVTIPAPTPAPTPEPTMESTPEPAPVTSPSTSPMTSATPAEMPETAGPIPLIALLGLASFGAAAAVRRARRG